MQLHQIKPKTKNKTKKRVGRGGKRGTYSGRGMKGQKSRAGRSMRPELRDIIKKLPKKRGYRFNSPNVKPATVDVGALDNAFKDGEKVTPQSLWKKGLISKVNGRFLPEVKLLGAGAVSRKLLVSKCQVSKSAKEKIEKAGGELALPSKVEKKKDTKVKLATKKVDSPKKETKKVEKKEEVKKETKKKEAK